MGTWFVTLVVVVTSIATSSICSANGGGSRDGRRSELRAIAERSGRAAYRGRRTGRERAVVRVDGSWLEACDGEPKDYGRCDAHDAHVRCFELENRSSRTMECGISMKASMISPTGYSRLYTANEHTLMYAGDSDWLCFSYDEILESPGGNAWQWRMAEVYEPEITCQESDIEAKLKGTS